MSLGNVVPGFIARDPEKAAALMEEMGHAPVPFVRTEGGPSSVLQSVIPGMEDWVPEDDTPEVQYMDEIGKSTIYVSSTNMVRWNVVVRVQRSTSHITAR